MTAIIKDGKLTLVLDLQDPTPSKSGKTLIVAGTDGFTKTSAQVDGKTVSVNVTAFIKPN